MGLQGFNSHYLVLNRNMNVPGAVFSSKSLALLIEILPKKYGSLIKLIAFANKVE